MWVSKPLLNIEAWRCGTAEVKAVAAQKKMPSNFLPQQLHLQDKLVGHSQICCHTTGHTWGLICCSQASAAQGKTHRDTQQASQCMRCYKDQNYDSWAGPRCGPNPFTNIKADHLSMIITRNHENKLCFDQSNLLQAMCLLRV